MRNTITRSFTTIFASCKVYESGRLLDAIVALPDFCTLVSTAEKYIRKNPSVISGKLVEVTELNKQSELYGMDESDFIRLAKPFENRSKEPFVATSVIICTWTLHLTSLPLAKSLSPLACPQSWTSTQRALNRKMKRQLPLKTLFLSNLCTACPNPIFASTERKW